MLGNHHPMYVVLLATDLATARTSITYHLKLMHACWSSATMRSMQIGSVCYTPSMTRPNAVSNIQLRCYAWRMGTGPSANELAVRRRSGVDGHANLLHQPQVVAVIPNLGYLALANAEDIHPRESGPLAGRLHVAPGPALGALGRPSGGNQVTFGENDVHIEREIREGPTEIGG
jgi:hypothetical protein